VPEWLGATEPGPQWTVEELEISPRPPWAGRSGDFQAAAKRLYGQDHLNGQANVPVRSSGLGGSANRPKIPYVCGQLGIDCLGFIDLIRTEGWRL